MSNQDKEQFVMSDRVKDINIREFFEVLKRRFWVVVLITIIATAAGYYLSNQNNTPIYQTSTRIIIDSDEGYMSTLMVMIKDPIIMEKVKEELKLSRSSESIASQIEVTRVDESQVIMIAVTDGDPKVAMDIANFTAKSFKSEAGNILEFKDVQLLSEAKQNNLPINENQNRTVVIASIFGLVVGVGLVFILDSLDDRVDKESDVENVLGVPVIGVVSKMKTKRLSPQKTRQKKVDWRESKIG